MITLTVPIATPNPLNGAHRHWSAKAKIRREQREAVLDVWLSEVRVGARALRAVTGTDLAIKFTRISAGQLDDDNLRAALKSVRDEISACLGFANDSDPRVTWEYAQERGKRGQPAVRIEIGVRNGPGRPSGGPP